MAETELHIEFIPLPLKLFAQQDEITNIFENSCSGLSE